MANPRNKKTNKNNVKSFSNDKSLRRQLANINNLLGQANLNLYGTDRTSEIDNLNSTFNNLLNEQLGKFTNHDESDISSFLAQIVSNDNKATSADELINNQFLSLSGSEYSTMQSLIYDAYRNRLLEQSDLHEVSSQLIELSEAILITRDAIISPDIVEGRMSRNFHFENIDDDIALNNKSIVEHMEQKFKLLEKIKNFIVPKTLEYGEYYVYIMPYAKIFNDFMKAKELDRTIGEDTLYSESTLMENFNESKNSLRKNKLNDDLDTFLESVYEDYNIQSKTRYDKNDTYKEDVIPKSEFKKDMKNILSNITICNDEVPLPIIEEGVESIEYLRESYMESITEADKNKDDIFEQISKTTIKDGEGIHISNEKTPKKNKKGDFDNICDCYIKMIEPTKIVPIEIMNTVVGYYLVTSEDITPLSGAVSNTLYFSKFDENRREKTIIDAIATRVVKSFNKDFLNKNIKFKEVIMDCLEYYNLNEKKLRFQFVPADYIQVFKIDEDVDGRGTSMLKKSLFYAKLYLMLLLFKIMSIILNSNDTKVNYIKQSGIDKNLANKVQEIARINQSRKINITDLFSYTTLINKVGNGSEMYIPTGRSGERPIETEILAGQDIQLNTELLEMLKNAYILGTGVPAAIVNYLQEADFAKTIEQNNSKFNGRVVNYQLDFNSSITSMYKKIMRYSTSIPEDIIESFSFELQPPKSTSINTKSELINQFNTLCDFLISLLYSDPQQQDIDAEELQKEIREFKKLLAEDQLPMIDMSKVEELVNKARLIVKENLLKPNPDNGDNGDDDGLEEELDNIQI